MLDACYFCGETLKDWQLYKLFGVYPTCNCCMEKLIENFKKVIEEDSE